MPQDWLSEIQSSVDQILKSKRVASMSEIKKSWIQFKNPQLDEVKGYFKSSSQDVLSKIQKLIPIYFLKEMAQSAFIKNAPIGGLDQLPHLPEVKKAEIKNSMIFKGQALGKFYCFTDQKALLLTRQSSLGVLIHEYLHSLQSINNFAYCEALTNQQATEKKFLSGQLSKEVYENQMFKYQTMNAMAEIEVYRILIENPSVFSSEENINNQVVLKEYEKQWF